VTFFWRARIRNGTIRLRVQGLVVLPRIHHSLSIYARSLKVASGSVNVEESVRFSKRRPELPSITVQMMCLMTPLGACVRQAIHGDKGFLQQWVELDG
jgi:hypothetical protein